MKHTIVLLAVFSVELVVVAPRPQPDEVAAPMPTVLETDTSKAEAEQTKATRPEESISLEEGDSEAEYPILGVKSSDSSQASVSINEEMAQVSVDSTVEVTKTVDSESDKLEQTKADSSIPLTKTEEHAITNNAASSPMIPIVTTVPDVPEDAIEEKIELSTPSGNVDDEVWLVNVDEWLGADTHIDTNVGDSIGDIKASKIDEKATEVETAAGDLESSGSGLNAPEIALAAAAASSGNRVSATASVGPSRAVASASVGNDVVVTAAASVPADEASTSSAAASALQTDEAHNNSHTEVEDEDFKPDYDYDYYEEEYDEMEFFGAAAEKPSLPFSIFDDTEVRPPPPLEEMKKQDKIPSACEWGVVNCCSNPDAAGGRIKCFERLGCPGAWLEDLCTPSVKKGVLLKVFLSAQG